VEEALICENKRPKLEDESLESTRSPDTTGDSLCSVSVFKFPPTGHQGARL